MFVQACAQCFLKNAKMAKKNVDFMMSYFGNEGIGIKK